MSGDKIRGPSEFGVIGLGRIGGGLSLQALEKGYRIVGCARHGAPEHLTRAGMIDGRGIAGLREALGPPRIVFIYVPAGPPVDQVIDQLAPHLDPGDIVIDGGNSYWGDSIRRYERLRQRGIHLLDVGTSGGVRGARSGACFMAGGDQEAVRQVEPILKALAVENGYVYAGRAGAGHFVKLVHNGIEFGMLQAIGEGIDLLSRYREPLDIGAVLSCWRNGSVIRSWLIDLMEEAHRAENGLEQVPGFIEDTGEVNWLVADALHMEVPVPVIASAVMQLFASRDGEKHWARAIAMMRHGFGEHPYGPDEGIARSRQTERVGDYVRNPAARPKE
ncbi:MAG TPA: decarboxylating 6-phosphogluconate dehydrogenase [Burkholderiales bacterium]|nr:decarboxylating 6-phosphogluconate dehydrogenase [Burkholderiales bacterium]